jgi:hypothetical protein
MLAVAAGLALGTNAVRAQVEAPPVLIETSGDQRRAYLAEAQIWKPGGIPTPEQLREGPPGRTPLRGIPVGADGEVSCTYERGGAGLPGRTAKFTCRTEAGRSIRVKYYDGNPKTGNREVFAELLATRLFWALGFDADAVYPVVVRCLQCPSNPNTGAGPRESRRFLGIVEALYEGTPIASKEDLDQGWSFGEVRAAIAGLPHGELRARQQVHFEALSLLGVFIQHGDRKPTQQRLVCRSAVDTSAGEVHVLDLEGGIQLPVMLERPHSRACSATVLTVQDLGATFGGAGQLSKNATAKVHLSSWAGTPIFAQRSVADRQGTAARPCRGNITVSMAAGRDADDQPAISDEARRFLHGRLAALTSAHIRALFEVAHIDEVGEPQEWRDRANGRVLTGIDAWVAAFQAKVAEIGRTSCAS